MQINFKNEFFCQICGTDLLEKDTIMSLSLQFVEKNSFGTGNGWFNGLCCNDAIDLEEKNNGGYINARFHFECFKKVAGQEYVPVIKPSLHMGKIKG
jgi:hypothetical protein